MELLVIQPFRDRLTGELPPVGSVIDPKDARGAELVAAGVAAAVGAAKPKPRTKPRKRTEE